MARPPRLELGTPGYKETDVARSFRLSRLPLDLHVNAELAKPTQQSCGHALLVAVALYEILTTHVVEFHAVAAQAAWTSVVLSHGAPWRVRVERRLPALSSRRGHRPAHETRWPAVGNGDTVSPISARITAAAVSPRPGIVVRRSRAARKGTRASPIRASMVVTVVSSASICVRCTVIMKR